MKKLAAVAMALIVLFSMSSCGENGIKESESESATEISSDSERETELTSELTESVSDKPIDTTTRTESKTDKTTTEKTKDSDGIGEYLQKYVIDIIETGRYTMTVTAESDGLKMDYKGVISGENTMQEMNMLGLMTIRLISNDGKCYLISTKGKRYAEISFEEFEKQLDTIKNFSLEFKNLSLTDTENVKKNGKDYVVETYKDTEGKTSKYYFRNNALELIEIIDGGKTEERKYTISPEVDESALAIPSGYKKVDNPGDVLLGSVN